MATILTVRRLTADTLWMDVHAPRVAANCLPGQFLIVRLGEKGERIPLTICDYDRAAQTVAIVFQVVGASTAKMAALRPGDSFNSVMGPLGMPSELTQEPPETLRHKRILFVAGGVGAAPVYPQVKYLHEQNVPCECIVGARTQNLLILTDELRAVASTVHIATDDGTAGYHGRVTDLLRDLVTRQGKQYDLCVAIGPMVMMKHTALLTRELGIPTVVSLNPVMMDGTGMCGACRITVGGQVKFACVDGPEFDGHQVNFDEAMNRQTLYKTQEGRAMLALAEGRHTGGCCDKEENVHA